MSHIITNLQVKLINLQVLKDLNSNQAKVGLKVHVDIRTHLNEINEN